ncbi:hypothetical protein N7492_008424 [Penicillium capsulatum]|uniref:Mitogen-activated protein kinase kinae kinase bck1 n=1 Tax=Penicillium capsulatum TaxID=69766 RepID=A0A9W9LFX2_9EURO|nr:hypothetical protein N7492_008424 [Penicillium capsulatum]KAJ6105826.1 hypothetical protein N7512_009343 [Penicillium capsulatum]
MDGQRQYIPGISGQPPPPPPLRHPAQPPPMGLPPPPSGPPPGSYAVHPHPQYQQSYPRMAMNTGYPIPPPPPIPQYRPQPLTYATYVPGNDTIGGFPPLFEPQGRVHYDPYGQRPAVPQQTHEYPTADPSFNPQTPAARYAPTNYLHNDVHELVSHENSDLSKSPSHRYNSSGTSMGGISPSKASTQWPLDVVLLWLAKNGFSKDWQETIKSLELQGSDFLELGLASGGRGNLGKMHQVVYPQLAKECVRSGTGWDQARERRERDEGLRMKKLIRLMHDNTPESATTPLRPDPPTIITGFADNAPSSSNQFGEPYSAGPFTGGSDIPDASSSGQGQRQNPQTRVVTEPARLHKRESPYDSPSRESPPWQRSEFSSKALSGLNDHRRQSPSTSSDHGTLPNASLRPQDSPKSGSPAAHYVSPAYAALTSSSTENLNFPRPDHSRKASSESNPGANRGSSTTGRYYDQRRQGQEGARPSPHEPQGRPWTSDNSTNKDKEHNKGIFSRLLKKRPNDPGHPSPEELHLESPSSPDARSTNGYMPYQKPGFSSSDLSVGERPLSTVMSKKWIFATLDGLNYRLIDVSDMDSVETLREGICQGLGLSDWTSAQIFLTEPGKTDHDDPMSDTLLTLARRNKSDAYGSLKLFVQVPSTHQSKHRPPRFDGLGVSIPIDKPATSPTGAHAPIHRKPLDEEALSRISPQTAGNPDSPILGSKQSTLKASGNKMLPDDSQDSSQLLDTDKKDFLARHEAHLRDVERKQRENNISRVPLGSQQSRKDTYSDTGYRRGGVIDFDSPRISPYEEKKSPGEEKKPDPLVPFRKPPTAPNESNTLTKVNSLRKHPNDRSTGAKPPSAVQTHGLGAALTSVGRIGSAIGTPLPSVPVPPSPSSANRDSVGSDSDRPATMDSAATASSKTTLDSFKTGQRSSADPNSAKSFASGSGSGSAKPASPPQKPSLQSRKSFGPEFDFEENEVSFQRTPQPMEDSDDDDSSDDGLFAIPLANKAKPEPEPKVEEPPAEDPQRKPRKSRVTIESPVSAAPGFPPQSSGGDGQERFPEPVSPEDDRPVRRNSFANGDVWASRPPVEGVIQNLDNFFPDVDLDAPYLEDEPPSPNSNGDPSNGAVSRAKQEGPPPIPQPAVDLSSLSGFDTSTVRPQAPAVTRLKRNETKNGLSRAKSIRQVAEGAAHRTKSISSAAGPQRSGDLLRRKSTKMFGGKIMQIRPQRGSRLSQLEPIPQNASIPGTSGAVPQRQPTFRIIRGQLIGKGTYGRVYLGMNADNGEVLAVKQVEINARIAGSDRDRIKEMVAALDQEIDTMQHLEHPNIVQYLGCERGDLSISIYLEYISGGSIGSCLRKHGKFEESVVKSLTRQTLDGLAYLHNMGILHRDLKADNILLDLDGTCKISDFGISKKTDDIYGNDSSNSMQGSVFWMAPEVIQSQGQGYSAKVDIWSLGCVVLEMFAGRRPWSREEAIGAIFKLGSLGQAPPIPEDVSMNISPAALAFMWDCFTVYVIHVFVLLFPQDPQLTFIQEFR